MSRYNTQNRFEVTGKLESATPDKTKNGKDVTKCLLLVDDEKWNSSTGSYGECVSKLAFSVYGKKREAAEGFAGKHVTITYRLDSFDSGGSLYEAKPEIIKIELAAVPESGARLSDGLEMSTAEELAANAAADDDSELLF